MQKKKSTTATVKKYKLHSKSETDDGKPVLCAFVSTAGGCRNGTNCAFLHELPTAPPPSMKANKKIQKKKDDDDESVVSSESESDASSAGDGNQIAPSDRKDNNNNNNNKKKRKREGNRQSSKQEEQDEENENSTDEEEESEEEEEKVIVKKKTKKPKKQTPIKKETKHKSKIEDETESSQDEEEESDEEEEEEQVMPKKKKKQKNQASAIKKEIKRKDETDEEMNDSEDEVESYQEEVVKKKKQKKQQKQTPIKKETKARRQSQDETESSQDEESDEEEDEQLVMPKKKKKQKKEMPVKKETKRNDETDEEEEEEEEVVLKKGKKQKRQTPITKEAKQHDKKKRKRRQETSSEEDDDDDDDDDEMSETEPHVNHDQQDEEEEEEEEEIVDEPIKKHTKKQLKQEQQPDGKKKKAKKPRIEDRKEENRVDSKFKSKEKKSANNERASIKSNNKRKDHQRVKGSASSLSFLDSLDLNVSPFALPISGTDKQANDDDATDSSSQEKQPNKKKKKKKKSNLPFPTHASAKWQDAVTATRRHWRFDGDFDFDHFKARDEEKGIVNNDDDECVGWMTTKPYGDWCKNLPKAIAIDCEMCETKCPTTGATNPKALCRVSIVNAETPSQVLLDTLVQPEWPVQDYRTWVNGIAQEHLEGVKFTMKHLHLFLNAMCSEETIIVGHAIQNDLVAMRMEHYVHIDSSFLFPVKDKPNMSPALKEIAASALGKEMPETHDSVNDARTALEAVQYWINKKGQVEPIVKQTGGNYVRNKEAACQLMIHRIPTSCRKEHLELLFCKYANVVPSRVDDIEQAKTLVTFASWAHANLAFKSIMTEAKADTSGRLQKTIPLIRGGYLRVRKMVHESREQQQQQQQQQSSSNRNHPKK